MINCYFDGACEPRNPGGNMGIGSIIMGGNVVVYKGFVVEHDNNSNNVAEYLALESILKYFTDNPTEEDVMIHGDSKLVINQMIGKWKIKEGRYVKAAMRCRKLLAGLKNKIVFKWISRWENEIADRYSKEELIKNKVQFKIQPQ